MPGAIILTTTDGPVNGDPLAILDAPTSLGALAQAVLISLLSWRRAEDGDPLPSAGERNGWWADGFAGDGDLFGARTWILLRNRATVDAASAARQYAQEALAWLITDGLAARIDAQASVAGDALGLTVQVWRDDGTGISLRFADLWSAINA